MSKDRFCSWKPPVFDEDGWAYSATTGKRFGWRCQNSKGLKLGKKVDVGCFSYLNAKYGIEIGDDVQIGAGCAIYSEDTERGVSGNVYIGKGSLIGAHTVILPGVRIEDGTKIKAGSVIK